MYNKLFGKIVHSSIWLSPDPHRIAWITFLALMDEDGFVNLASPANLAHTARIPLEDAISAVSAFENPDQLDPTQENEGRRIERVPGGWMVLNASKYREMATRETIRDQTRRRVKAFREKKQGNAPVTQRNEKLTLSDTDTDTDTDTKKPDRAARRPKTVSEPEGFDEIRKAYPKRAGSQRWPDAINAYRARLKEGATPDEILAGVERYAAFVRSDGKESTEYVQQAATFIGKNRGYAELWKSPPSKAEAKQAANIDASLRWLAKEESSDAIN